MHTSSNFKSLNVTAEANTDNIPFSPLLTDQDPLFSFSCPMPSLESLRSLILKVAMKENNLLCSWCKGKRK